ncbi:MAG: cation diffusion facilitator family transporter [Myxococcales bacterium]|nr:cation diffusion facilitator family transporter [Myxococcales bacterium]
MSTRVSSLKMHRELHREALRFAGLCLAVNTLMAGLKVGVGIYSGSHALLANALYSVNDLLSAVAVAVSLRVGHRRPDAEHPYGFGKAEFIAAGMVSLVIAIGVFFMFFFSVIDILRGVPGPPHFTAMSLAALSAVVSYMLSRKGHTLGVRLHSPVLNTTAEHHHADAEGSVAALIGVGGAVLGLHVLDRIIAVFETLHLIALSGRLLARSVRGLMDVAISEEDREMVERACLELEGVDEIAHVWSRQAGSDTWVDVALAVADDMTVERAHALCEQAKQSIKGVLGATVRAQVRFQGPSFAYELPGPGGGH